MNTASSVSVIIPAYNASRTIGRALASVVAQTHPPCEIIVVDDGSTDALLEALLPFSEHVKYVRQSNSGASAARNKGCSIAGGDFLAFLDADDVWHPEKLKRQIETLNQFSEAGMCWSDPEIISESSADRISEWMSVSVSVVGLGQIARFEDIFLSPYLGTPNVLIRRSVFEESGGFDTAFVTAEDLDLWMRVAYKYGAVHLPQVLCLVLRQSESLSTRHSEKLFSDHLAVIDKFCRLFPSFEQSHSLLVREARAKVYEHWGSSLLTDKNFRAAMKVLWSSIRLKPTGRAGYLWIKAIFMQVTGK